MQAKAWRVGGSIYLQQLSKQCDFQNVTAENYRLELMRDALIAGLSSTPIRLRLLENRNLAFQEAYHQARAQELAYKYSEAYQSSVVSSIATKAIEHSSFSKDDTEIFEVLRALTLFNTSTQLCFFLCGKHRHPRKLWPSRDAICHFCQKSEHFASVGMSKTYQKSAKINIWKIKTIYYKPYKFMAGTSALVNRTLKAVGNVEINGLKAKALMDTEHSDCYINCSFAEKYSLVIQNSAGEVTLAEASMHMHGFGKCFVNLYKAMNRLLTFLTILKLMLSSERKFFKNTKK